MVEHFNVSDHAGLFLPSSGAASSQRPRILSMNQSNSMAKQIADGASAFEQKKTDHAPKAVTVMWE
ncbi:MAG TPA: hypothetical protein VG759_02370 [Candidatus Angelobacter sp.]|nr:hypothetical protein [Candidatus Angelobacter sp.]